MLRRTRKVGRRERPEQVVAAVAAAEEEMRRLDDRQLAAVTGQLKRRLERGEPEEDIQAEAYAAMREASARILGQRPHDVQVLGAAVLQQGGVAEMRTGEGKTLTAAMAAYLNALRGEGVHQVTVNDYLADRDAEWMGRIHRHMGLDVGVITSDSSAAERKAAYRADITYGTTNQFGFDLLRDSLAQERGDQVQRPLNMAIIDEVDSVLIDEARTPLIISGEDGEAEGTYRTFAEKIVPALRRGEVPDEGDYLVDETAGTVAITDRGAEKVERLLDVDDLQQQGGRLLLHLQNAIRAKELQKRDRDYIVQDGQVRIVDRSTGRILNGRRYADGLHQAIEAKEKVAIGRENRTLATITVANLYRSYRRLAGMSGTAASEQEELLDVYGLRVVKIPTNRPVIRQDHPDIIHRSLEAKFEAVAAEIHQRQQAGQPVLAGTGSVEASEKLSEALRRQGVKHRMLNAKNHAEEAEIIAEAGREGAVTVATNMAGRGTDIILGGSGGEAEAERVRSLGGLMVIGTERHESRRIDEQLRGRAGRQGDPGESRFHISLQDDLLRLFNADAAERAVSALRLPDRGGIESRALASVVAGAQKRAENIGREQRARLIRYDDVLEEQRRRVRQRRQQLLEGSYTTDDLRGIMRRAAERTAADAWTRQEPPRLQELLKIPPQAGGEGQETLLEQLTERMEAALQGKIAAAGDAGVIAEAARRTHLAVLDQRWKDHLQDMTGLRDGIGLRALGGQDPLTEYRREAQRSYTAMIRGVEEETVGAIITLRILRDGVEITGG